MANIVWTMLVYWQLESWLKKLQSDSVMPIFPLTHLGRVTHKCVSKLTIIGSEITGSAIIRNNAGLLSIGPLGTNFINLYIFIQENKFKSVVWKMAAVLPRPQCVKGNMPYAKCQAFVQTLMC